MEKVRWSLDRLGVPYEEEHTAGILGALFRGRTVPRLYVTTGRVTSVVGNSPEILRYLWGRYGVEQGEHAAFLQPTAAALELEHKFDEYGVDLQRWIYSHILSHKEFTLHIWGRDDPTLPAWQRATLTVLYPLLRLFMQQVFHLSPSVKQTSRESIERVLGDVEERLADGQTSLLGGPLSFVDITFAALSAPWVDPGSLWGGESRCGSTQTAGHTTRHAQRHHDVESEVPSGNARLSSASIVRKGIAASIDAFQDSRSPVSAKRPGNRLV